MTLQLDPRVPVVWRSPSSLQFGVDSPRLVLEKLSTLDERLIAALRRGSQRERLVQLASSVGGDSASVNALLTLLDPVLLSSASQRHAPLGRVFVDGDGHTATAVQHAVDDDGFAISVTDAPDFVVLIGHYAIAPRRYGHWLRNDVPLMPIVFSDDGVRIGPLVLPGSGPCLYCIDLTRTDADAAWPAIASQLLDGVAPGETPRAAAAVATVVGAVLAEWFGPASETEQVRIIEQWVGNSVRMESTGWVSRAQHRPHPACGCQLLAASPQAERSLIEAQVPQENEKPVEETAAAGR